MGMREESRGERSARFERRRAEILDTASREINVLGVRGMTLTGVARRLGLDTSSVTYYFRRKEELAFACLERSLLWMRDRAAEAVQDDGAYGMVDRFIGAHICVHRRNGSSRPQLALLSDMHSMPVGRREELSSLYARTAEILRNGLAPMGARRSLVSTLVLLAAAHWIPSWIAGYSEEDFERVQSRLVDVLMKGLSANRVWFSEAAPPVEPDGGDAQARFLLAATNLINREGYHGASVEKIAAELGVSTGSFYHHLENKDDLVLACFERSFGLIGDARRVGEVPGRDRGGQLADTFASLFRLQVDAGSPLLRSSAYQALPPPLRSRMLARTGQMSRHFCGVLADGIAEGSIRAVDPMIGGHVFVSTINAAADLRDWTGTEPMSGFLSIFLTALATGIRTFTGE